jgi:2'-phosphotransferase
LKRPKLKGVDVPTLQRIVAENSKQRYAIREEPNPEEPEEKVLWIRANQGHTLEVQDLELTRIEKAEDCPVVVHGTFTRHWEAIRAYLPMTIIPD